LRGTQCALRTSHGRFPIRNGGVYEHVAHRIFAAADGFVAGGYSGSNRMWTDLLAWMVEEGEAADLVDEKWSDPVVRWQGRPHVDEVVARFVAKRGARAVAEEARARRCRGPRSCRLLNSWKPAAAGSAVLRVGGG
jgi:hypothetical protein